MKRGFIELTDNDIKNNKFMYTAEQLEYSIVNDNLSLRIVSRFQKLTPYICAKYVIFGGNNEIYGDCTEDRWLDDYNILTRQPHITREELSDAHRFVAEEEKKELSEIILMSNEDKLNSLKFFK